MAKRAGSSGASAKKNGGDGKVTRETFTMPIADARRLQALRLRVMKLGIDAPKSQIVRAGIAALDGLDDAELSAAVEAIERLKPGRKR